MFIGAGMIILAFPILYYNEKKYILNH